MDDRHLRRLQLLAIAAASSLLLFLLAVHAPPPSTGAHDAAPLAVNVSIHGPRRLLGPRHRLVLAEAITPITSSSTEEEGVVHNAVLRFFNRFVVFFAMFIMCLCAAFVVVHLVKLVVIVAAYAAGRCTSAWRSVKEAREKATRVRPLDADADD